MRIASSQVSRGSNSIENSRPAGTQYLRGLFYFTANQWSHARRAGSAPAVGFGGGARYNPKYEHIWDTIASFKPDAFLFLGDNLYIDLPLERNTQRLYYYRRQLRPEFQRMTSAAAMRGSSWCMCKDVPDSVIERLP